MNCIARRTRSQATGWKIIPPNVEFSRRKHSRALHCSSSRKCNIAEEIIFLSEEEDESDHMEKLKTKKRGLNVWKDKAEEDNNHDNVRKFARKRGCSSSWEGKAQSTSFMGSQRSWSIKMKCRKQEITSVSGKGKKKGAVEHMISGDGNEDSSEVEELARRPLIQARKVRKIASSREDKRREKASTKLDYAKKWNLQRSEGEVEESISTSADIDDSVSGGDYIDGEEERSTSPLRRSRERIDSKGMRAGSPYFFQEKGEKIIFDLVSSEDDDDIKQMKKEQKAQDSLGSSTRIREAKQKISEKERSFGTTGESMGERKNDKIRDGRNNGDSRNEVLMECANKKRPPGKKVEEEGTQSESFDSAEEREEDEDTDEDDDEDDDDDYSTEDDDSYEDSEDDEDYEEEYKEEIQVENLVEQNRSLKKSEVVMKKETVILKNEKDTHGSRFRHDICKKQGRQDDKTRSHMEKNPNIRSRTSYSEDAYMEVRMSKEVRDTFTKPEANYYGQSTHVVVVGEGYADNGYGNTTNGKSDGAGTSSEKRDKKKKNDPMEFSLFDLLMDTINKKRDVPPENVKADEEVPVKMKLPLKWSSGESEPEKSDSEIELDDLWNELNFALRLDEFGSPDLYETKGEPSMNMTESPTVCQHQFLLDEEIGIVCKVCDFVKLEIKYAMPPMIKRIHGKTSKKAHQGEEILDVHEFEFEEFRTQGCNSKTSSTGTVWDLIPDLKEKMFHHQKEGFEFIWKNLGGGIAIGNLKSTSSDDIGGCLISHAPGTGKTLLTIAFLRSFLLLFDDIRPMIVAPLILLSTWENEFRKWGIGVPFHNLSDRNFSGKENSSVLAIFRTNVLSMGCGRKHNLWRMVKIFSWIRDKSILGISYNLFGKLTAGKQHGRGQSIRNLLLEYPGLLVLDEGHIARNKHSKLWKCLKQVRTQRRIMLSGTPFQNNFDQLFSTLYLIRPNFAECIFQRLKDHQSCLDVDQASEEYLLHGKNERVLRRSFASFSEGIEPEETSSQLKQLRSIIDPFIHIHEGTLRELPGLRDYFVYLYPSALQRCLLDKLTDRTNFDYDHKVSCICIHPSLLLGRSSQKDNEKDRDLIQEHILELSKEQIHDGVKTRFVIDLIQLCEAMNEKVLVFSQFIDPLLIIKRHIISFFGWTDGREVLQLDGSIIDQKQRQSVIHNFNDMSKEVKVLLVSTKVCAEGIDLTGASRVVLLDLVWNPSVRKQAISRAYRIGQQKVVYAYNLIASSTLEEKKYNIQDTKEKFGRLVFAVSAKNHTGATLVDIMENCEDNVLFELINRDTGASLFQRVIELKYSQGQ